MKIVQNLGLAYVGPHPDPNPDGEALPLGSEYIDLDTGGRFIVAGSGRGFLPVLGANAPGSPVTPLLGGAETPFFVFGNGVATVYYFRVLFNATDDTDAQTRLHRQWGGVATMRPGDDMVLEGWTVIRRIDIVAYASADNIAGGLMDSANNATEVGARMQTWTFNPDDRVLRVHLQALLANASSNVHLNLFGVGYA